MARTPAGATLTEAHRVGQLRIRANTLRDYMRLWPLWKGDERTFQDLIAASLPLLQVNYGLSRSLSSGYYEAFRTAERAGGSPTPRLAGPLDTDKAAGTLYVTGQEMTKKALIAGQSPEAAMQAALVRTSGSMTRLALEGGRTTLLQSTSADRAAQGYVRVTSGNPCAFCALLAGRGPAYSEESVDFQAHDHCDCSAEPSYAGSEWPGRAREFHDLYNQSVKQAREAGDLRRGTSNDLLNAFRRNYSA